MLVWSEVLKQYIYKCWDEPKVISATVGRSYQTQRCPVELLGVEDRVSLFVESASWAR